MFPNGSFCMKCLDRIVCEADVGADHARQLRWQPDEKQKRSLGVRLPESVGAPAVPDALPKGHAKAKRQALLPRGSVAEQIVDA